MLPAASVSAGRLILGHWGEMLVPFPERVDILSRRATDLDRRVGEYVTGNVHVTAGGILSQRMLDSTMAAMGADRIVFAFAGTSPARRAASGPREEYACPGTVDPGPPSRSSGH